MQSWKYRGASRLSSGGDRALIDGLGQRVESATKPGKVTPRHQPVLNAAARNLVADQMRRFVFLRSCP